MSSKPETTYIALVHRNIVKVTGALSAPYHEKMNNPFRSGTPDVFYSGDKGDLWVEYKYLQRIPKSAEILPELSPRQSRWLNDRFDEGRNLMVVVGTPEGGVIFREKEWGVPLNPTLFRARLMLPSEVARKIITEVGTSQCHSLLPSRPSSS